MERRRSILLNINLHVWTIMLHVFIFYYNYLPILICIKVRKYSIAKAKTTHASIQHSLRFYNFKALDECLSSEQCTEM